MGTRASRREALEQAGLSFATWLPWDVYFVLIKPLSQQLTATVLQGPDLNKALNVLVRTLRARSGQAPRAGW